MLKTPPLLLLSITTLTLVSSMLGINRAYAQTNTVDSSCASSQFGCFEVGLPGSKKFAAGQNIAAFTDSPAPIRDLVNLFVTFITGILVIVGVITIVIGGYMYMTAGGNASQVSSAKEMITAALIGIFIAFISVVILNTVNPFLGRSAVEPKLGSPQPSSAILNDTSSGGNNNSSSSTNSSAAGNTTNSNTTTNTASQITDLQAQEQPIQNEINQLNSIQTRNAAQQAQLQEDEARLQDLIDRVRILENQP
jgi:TM2 domain-containing membrane protein YozV